MKITKILSGAIAVVACVAIAAIAALLADRSGLPDELAREAAAVNQQATLHASDERAIEIDDVLNYHLNVHG